MWAQSTNGKALEVEGKVTFTRSGAATRSAAATSVVVTVPGGPMSTSHVLATLQTNHGTLAVRAAVPDTSNGKVTIYFTASAQARRSPGSYSADPVRYSEEHLDSQVPTRGVEPPPHLFRQVFGSTRGPLDAAHGPRTSTTASQRTLWATWRIVSRFGVSICGGVVALPLSMMATVVMHAAMVVLLAMAADFVVVAASSSLDQRPTNCRPKCSFTATCTFDM